MQYELLYPPSEGDILDAPCVIVAACFEKDELLKAGVDSEAMELDPAFSELNEFEKAFALWRSPLYLSTFYEKHQDFLKQKYWSGVTDEIFFKDVNQSISRIQKDILRIIEDNDFPSIVEPLGKDDIEARDCDSIRVKIKKGTIQGRHPFRFYAIEVEENKCYIITGATIKVHKDMKKAPNTRIELAKLTKVYGELAGDGIKTKDEFISYLTED